MSSWFCAVPDCKNNSSNSHVSFKHDFPRGGLMKQKWLEACGIKEAKKNTKVCRDHFHERDYTIFSHSPNGGCRLRPNVVPSKNMGRDRALRSSREFTSTPNSMMTDYNYISEVSLEELKEAARNTSIKVMLDKREALNGIRKNGSINGEGEPCKKLKLSEAKEPPKLPTTSQAIILLMNSDPYKYLGLTPASIDLVETLASNISISEMNVILTFRKLKLDEDLSVLEDYFNLKDGEAKELFCYTTKTIARFMQSLVQLPSKYVVFEDIPVSARRKLCQTRFYLSSFPVVIEKTQDLYINEVTFNGTKHVINYFFLVTPDGCIAHVSPGYGGRLTPEKTLPAIKSIRELIEDGFNIIDLVPEFQEDEEDPEKNLNFEQKLAFETIKRMRQFTLINNKKALTSDFVKLLDEIVIIIAAMVNLQSVNYDDDEQPFTKEEKIEP